MKTAEVERGGARMKTAEMECGGARMKTAEVEREDASMKTVEVERGGARMATVEMKHEDARMKTVEVDRGGARMKTAEVLSAMFRENTGSHLLDSGDVYGRHWEQNQVRDVALDPPVWLDSDGDLHISAYHYCLDRLTYDEVEDAKFQSFLNENRTKGYYALMQEYAGCRGHNTYNYENALTQVLQFVVWRQDERHSFVLLQIHNGCDVRGGYTRPRVFRADEELPFGADIASAVATCSNEHTFETDDGYYWYDEEGTKYTFTSDTCPICNERLFV